MDLETPDAFAQHAKSKAQALYRERQVDNLQNLIYTEETAEDTSDERAIDSNRYLPSRAKLELFKRKSMKKLVKRRFVTGQNSDQIVKNLLNMSDSEDEAALKDGEKIDKE